MPNYNEAQGVADLLSQFDFNIINEGPGDFSTQHRKYTCEFSKPGIESFTTTYQSNPDVHGQPTATDVFAALASDALAVDGLLVDTFADELGFEKPSQAIRAYESCHKTLDWLKNDLQLMTSEISDIAGTLDNELGEVKEQVERVQEERKAKHEFEHPPVPEGFTSIEDLQARLDLGEYGDRITDYTGNIGDAFGEIADSNVDLYSYDLLKWLPDNYKSENMTFSAQDTNGLDIDGEVFFCGLTHEELTGMVGKQTGEDFTVESVGEPYQVEAHPKSQEPSQPRLAEKVKETRDGSGKLEQDSHDGQTTEREDEREDERADGDAEH